MAETIWRRKTLRTLYLPVEVWWKYFKIVLNKQGIHIFPTRLPLKATVPGFYFRPLIQSSALFLPSSLVTTAKCEEFFNHFSHLIIKQRRQSYKCLPHHVKYLACPKLVPLFTHFRCHEILFLRTRFLAHLVFKMCFIHSIEPNILSIINSYLSSATFPSNLLKKSTL